MACKKSRNEYSSICRSIHVVMIRGCSIGQARCSIPAHIKSCNHHQDRGLAYIIFSHSALLKSGISLDMEVHFKGWKSKLFSPYQRWHIERTRGTDGPEVLSMEPVSPDTRSSKRLSCSPWVSVKLGLFPWGKSCQRYNINQRAPHSLPLPIQTNSPLLVVWNASRLAYCST